MLVGLPGVGKSTWVSSYYNKNYKDDDIKIVSTDDIIETLGKRHEMTYNQMFDPITYSFAEKMMYKIAKHHISNADNKTVIVWDQTNLTIKTRQAKLKLFDSSWRKNAFIFPLPEDHEDRLKNRVGKDIPEHILASMLKNYQAPTHDEGFDLISIVS